MILLLRSPLFLLVGISHTAITRSVLAAAAAVLTLTFLSASCCYITLRCIVLLRLLAVIIPVSLRDDIYAMVLLLLPFLSFGWYAIVIVSVSFLIAQQRFRNTEYNLPLVYLLYINNGL